MALNGLYCADVPLRNYSLTHPPSSLSTQCVCSFSLHTHLYSP